MIYATRLTLCSVAVLLAGSGGAAAQAGPPPDPPQAQEVLEVTAGDEFLVVEQSVQLNVTRTLPNGSVVDLTDPMTGSIYASSDSSVATVGSTGMVAAVGIGSTVIHVINGDILDESRDMLVGSIEMVVGTVGDTDGDGVPDVYETANNLNPFDWSDAWDDPDLDGLSNIDEFELGTSANNRDTDGDGRSDGAELAAGSDPLVVDVVVLDETWTAMVNGQFVYPQLDGSFFMFNVSAPDRFGLDGPGSQPDFLGDDFVRVVATQTIGGQTRWAFSDPFQIMPGKTQRVGDLRPAYAPPFPQWIRMTVPVILTPTETTQVTVTGVLGDGAEIDVTPR